MSEISFIATYFALGMTAASIEYAATECMEATNGDSWYLYWLV